MTTRPAIAADFANADQRLADRSHDAVRQTPLTAAAHASSQLVDALPPAAFALLALSLQRCDHVMRHLGRVLVASCHFARAHCFPWVDLLHGLSNSVQLASLAALGTKDSKDHAGFRPAP